MTAAKGYYALRSGLQSEFAASGGRTEKQMKIKGLQKLTLLDYPDRTACTVFLGGCDFKCPFCHNMDIVGDVYPDEYITEDYLFDYLKKRRAMLDGVCITGGEPLMSPDVIDLIRKIKALGYAVKLDTNGSYPERLREIVGQGLVDYVAVDIKNSPGKYARTAGCPAPLVEKVKESVEFLKEGHVDYEFRTTVVSPLHDPSDFEEIGEWIKGAKRFFIQIFTDHENVPDRSLSAPSKESVMKMLETVRKYVPEAEVRGM